MLCPSTATALAVPPHHDHELLNELKVAINPVQQRGFDRFQDVHQPKAADHTKAAVAQSLSRSKESHDTTIYRFPSDFDEYLCSCALGIYLS